MKGAELKCTCGAGPEDVAPDREIGPREAVLWRCTNDHISITGYRPLTGEFEQMTFEVTEEEILTEMALAQSGGLPN